MTTGATRHLTANGSAALPPHVDALERLMIVSVGLTTLVLDEVAGPDLTLLGWRATVLLGESPSGIRLGELAERLRISRPSATKLMQRLERRGFVETSRDHADGRGRRLRLTWEGIRVRETVLRRRREIIAEAIAGDLPADLEAGLREISDRLGRWV